MFSGIVQAVAPIQSLEKKKEGARITVPAPENFHSLKSGASVAVDGVCLTLEEEPSTTGTLSFFIGAETNQLLHWSDRYEAGSPVNLEPSMRLGDPVDGHFVSGHVDSLGEVQRREFVGDSLILDILLQPHLLSLIWQKGSIALNGVSLTINEIKEQAVSVCLIPETQKRTNLGSKKPGDRLHVEPDVLARMVERQLSYYLKLRQEKGGE